MSGKPYTRVKDGVRLAVWLTPRAARNAVDGIATDADGKAVLRIRLNAPPVDGAANQALIAFLAESLGMRKKDVILQSGETSRRKIVHLHGSGVMAKLDAWLI